MSTLSAGAVAKSQLPLGLPFRGTWLVFWGGDTRALNHHVDHPSQVLGACGNSGNSSEPHLHFQLMDGPRFESSRGVEPVFAGVEVTRDGARSRLEAYTWRKDDHVHAP